MHFIVIADTDIGIKKQTNQDSVLIKHATYENGEILMCIICDGMGGLAKGELASSTVIRRFAKWFDKELPYELENIDLSVVAGKWSWMLKELNNKISEYGKNNGLDLGTTFTGILCINNQYVAVHVGDTRLYSINDRVMQLTTDQTFVAREVKKGTLTPEQARTDKRRNMLLQCVGASQKIEPEILSGSLVEGMYLLCSDGFRNEITERELMEQLNPQMLDNEYSMKNSIRQMVELVKRRGEKDNISAILIKVG